MSIDEQHVALPKLYGAPAYARPGPVVIDTPRPFDPDDLPLEVFQTEDEREFSSGLPAYTWQPGGSEPPPNGSGGGGSNGSHTLSGRPFRLRSIAGRLLGGD